MTKRSDTVIRVGASIIQHGHHNNRIYLLRLDPGDCDDVLEWIEETIEKERYTKVFAKVSAQSAPAFLKSGYAVEAEIPGFYLDGTACFFMGKYIDPGRQQYNRMGVSETLEISWQRAGTGHPSLQEGCTIREASESDAQSLAEIYASVFPTYPFPIDDPDYISDAIVSGDVRFFLFYDGDEIVAASSAELDNTSKTVEMTDFATLPSARGAGAAGALLATMEETVLKDGFHLAYTICRGEEPAVNILFARGGYRYAGTLPNNTQIGGGFESMNVWYKPLSSGFT
ncbi:putative beta-lysine N-acetyltransferase [Methanocalculus taiwanensis]|uniref:Beta-lysine N-acetyltransferase n=1 Tax=Methanocalculus taiwanensis TaxID=106207 RepID=A0ABD4TH63_9EURY|nr:putative beta-lysine N-acetyltransferase [Methanocalculus taiwanensis]MCQ1537549.1 putative beta-lysine N-acetyltransferase [Methanocalculus taiwanensis]